MNLRFKSAIVLGSAGLLLAIAACTSTNSVIVVSGEGGAGDGGPVIDPADTGTTPDADSPDAPATPALNPYGVPYPTQNIGTAVRAGATKGSVIANLKFTGYKPGAATTSSVQLADVFDPQGKTHDIVALVLNSGWDPPGRNMMTQLQAGMPTRVAILSILGEGTMTGTAATLTDLSSWKTSIALPTIWTVLDPSFAQFPSPLYDHGAVPALIILDARTMEIVSSEIGAPPAPKTALETFRDDTKARAPSY